MSLFGITLAPVFPVWLIIFLFSLGVVSVLIQFRVTREKLGEKRSLILSLLRLGAVSVLVAFALNPSIVTKKKHQISPSIAILVDTSQSMGQSDSPEKITRLDTAKALLLEGVQPILPSLSKKYEVNLYGLADSLRSLEPGELGSLNAVGSKGNVSEALKVVSEKNTIALLLSDGNVIWDERQAQQVPILSIPVGSREAFRDILISGFKAPSLAFRDRAVVIDITLKGHGYAGLTLPVLLKESDRLLTANNIRIPADSGEVTTTLSFTPSEIGQKKLSISQ